MTSRAPSDSSPGLHFQVDADPNPSLFASLPVVLGPGLLVLRFAPNALGCSQLTISAKESSGQTTDVTATVIVSASALSNSVPASNPSTGESLATTGHDSSPDDDLSPGSGALITTLAGNGNEGYSGDGRDAADSELNLPLGVATDSAGDIFIADTFNCIVREVNHSTGVITTVAGEGGLSGYSGDGGSATSAQLGMPCGVAVDNNNNLFIADDSYNVVREVNLTTGVITTVAGNGTGGYSGDDGPATAAELSGPFGLAVDNNDLFIADACNNVIREVNLSAPHTITTVAGNGGWGYSGDDSPATSAELNAPCGVAVDGSGNLFIADSGNSLIREVTASTGIISTVAGNYNDNAGNGGYSGDGGLATDAELSYPAGVAVDAAGDVFIADTNNSVIREVTGINGANPLINTIAGNYNDGGGYSGDGGLATSAQLNIPYSVAVDADGDLYTADWFNNAVREVSNKPVPTVTLGSSVATGGNPTYGDEITYTASVKASTGDTPTGTVAIFAGATYLGQGVLDADGVATIATTETPAGSDEISARYSGDANYVTSASAALPITACQATPTIGVTSANNPSIVGQSLELTATAPGDAGGALTFNAGSTVLGTASLAPTPCYALQFDGTQGGMTTTLAADPSQYLDLTLSSWVEVNGWSNDDGAGNNCASSIIACYDGPDGGFNRGFGLLTGGDWEVQVGNQCWDTRIPVTTSAWHYVSVVYSESNITFYCDGDAVSYGSPGTFGPYSSTMTLGFDDCGGCAQWLNGKIEETTVFGAALSESQEATLYNKRAGVYGSAGIPNLIAGYDFDEGQGTIAHDFSGDGYTGTILPGTLWGEGKLLDQEVSIPATLPAVGTYQVTASYSGDSNYLPATSAPLVQTAMQPYNAAAGQSLSFAATIDNPALQPGAAAEINWGDSTSPPDVSAGTMAVTTLANSGETVGVVTASHVYAQAGIYPIQVTAGGQTYDYTADVAASPVAIVGLSSIDGGSALEVGYDVTADGATGFNIDSGGPPGLRRK